ncbi:MAG: IS1380 family transposase [Desulfobacteraceae bacterium]|nr:MAG: IS1380 family transposase [Desulfobacteraceae bacterium]RPJ20740.1 MAG: IS1380 family transposase [Desulfobacteraceae bacterium]
MAQGELGFKYEVENQGEGMTGMGGIGPYLDLACRSGMVRSIERHVKARGEQGWTDAESVLSLVMLNLVGGDCVEDVDRLESDKGFCRLFSKAVSQGLSWKGRRGLKRRWRKEKRRSVPSSSAIFRYLAEFHDRAQEGLRERGKALIPLSKEALQGLCKVNADLVGFVQNNRAEQTATLDMDATLVETEKASALWCYEGYVAYQPINTWWAEQGLVVHTEFRDGNVPAGFEQRRVLEEALESLPKRVRKVRMRSDTAGYQHDLLRYCDEEKNKWCGRIEFAVGCDVTPEFKKAVLEVGEEDWVVLKRRERSGELKETARQWAEVCYVPNAIGRSKKGSEYRYLAIRERMQDQLVLPGMEQDEKGLPFQTMRKGGVRYKVFGIVTNMHWEGQELIEWHYKRCGRSEQAHSVMKEDLAGGTLPSGDFGENAAWWWIMVLAFNLNAALKSLVLGGQWVYKRMKAIRFHLINIPARIMERSRQLSLRLSAGDSAYGWLIQIRARIAGLASSG